MSICAICTLLSLSIICTFLSLYLAATLLSNSLIMGTNCGTTFSRYSKGHFSKASARIVWFVYAHVLLTTSIASSIVNALSSTRILINSGMTIVGCVSLIWITACSYIVRRSYFFSFISFRISCAALLTIKYCW